MYSRSSEAMMAVSALILVSHYDYMLVLILVCQLVLILVSHYK